MILSKSRQFLGGFRRSVEPATQFLAQHADRAPATLVRHAGMECGFMDRYGESLYVRPARPKTLPQHVEPVGVEHLVEMMPGKKTHKQIADKDVLLVRVCSPTRLRRGELASLTVGDVLLKQKVVVDRKGKGGKDRAIPWPEYTG